VIIQNKNKKKYLEERLKYGESPDLEDIQCLNLLIDVIQPKLTEIVIKEEFKKYCIPVSMNDKELRDRTIRDTGLIMLVSVNLFNIKIPWSWLKIYLPRYKTTKKKIFRNNYKIEKFVKNYLIKKFNLEKKCFV